MGYMGGPYNKDNNILGVCIRVPYLGKLLLRHEPQGFMGFDHFEVIYALVVEVNSPSPEVCHDEPRSALLRDLAVADCQQASLPQSLNPKPKTLNPTVLNTMT